VLAAAFEPAAVVSAGFDLFVFDLTAAASEPVAAAVGAAVPVAHAVPGYLRALHWAGSDVRRLQD
jgi:hypothetical protein